MARVKTAKQAAVAQKSKTSGSNARAGPGEDVSKKDKGKKKSKKSGEGLANDSSEELKAEILALGGDEEDYELLKDVDSDVEIEAGPSSSKVDKSLSKDISKFMKELNLPALGRKALEADEEEDEEEEESSDDEGEEGEGEDEDASESETSVDEGVKEPKGIPAQISKDSGSTSSKSNLLFDPTPHWYDVLPPLPPQLSPSKPDSKTITSLQDRAKTLHTTELTNYEKSNSANKLTASSSDAAFLQRVLSSGTLSDRLSALTLLAQSSPVHNVRALETLKGMGSKKGREESLKALRAIVDWWVGGGTPSRKLKYFIDQPLTHPGVTDKHLLVWYFEDWLKKYFYSILQLLETLSLDPLQYVRLQTMGLILNLLKEKPEQEQNLLRLLVNKLGDSDKPVASRASYHLLQLIQAHPSMKGVVVREMTSLVLRPSRANVPSTSTAMKGKQEDKRDLQQDHSKYYAAITCNQIMLTPTQADRDVAIQLINVYFELFKEILGQGEEPTAKKDVEADGEAGEEKGHRRKGKDNGKGKDKGKDKGKGKEEGFTEVEDANSRLISAILTGVNRALPFTKLGLENVEFTKHVDTLFLITHTSTFNISLQALRLILQICESFITSPTESSSGGSLSTSIIDRFYRTLYGSLQDPRLATSSKQAMYLNLLLKSMKLDRNIDRVKAFVRRFVQLLVSGGNGGVEFVAGGLFLLGEVFKSTSDLRRMLESPLSAKGRKADVDAGAEYDPKKRDPQFANASAFPLWEIVPLLSHYHPTVQLHASLLLSGRELNADADLSLNTLSHFLDRFVYKNPKKLKPKGTSAMQPSAASADGTSVRVVKGAHQENGATVNDEAFWSKNIQNVPVDQVFFHKYFSQKNRKEMEKADKVAKRKGGAEVAAAEHASELDEKSQADGDEEEEEDEEEAEIWKAIKATNPDLQGDDESALEPDDSGISSEEEEASDANNEEDGDPDQGDDDMDDDGMSLAEGSDAEDLIGLDDEMPDGLVEYPESGGDDEDEWGGIEDGNKKKRKGRHEDSKQKKKKLRSLPTFASYDDYAKMIEDGPEDDI